MANNTNVLAIGSVPVHRGVYKNTTIYYAGNQVTMCGSVFRAIGNNFSGYAPVTLNEKGEASFANTELWSCIIDNIDTYNYVILLSKYSTIRNIEIFQQFIDMLEKLGAEDFMESLKKLLDAIASGNFGGLSEEERAALDKLSKMFAVDETKNWLKVKGDTKQYFIPMTELSKPSTPSISTTTYYVVTGNAEVAVNNPTSGATLYYKIGTGSWTSASGNKIVIASGFSNTSTNTSVTKTIRLKASKNGESSDESQEYTITIYPKVATPAITASGNEYSASRTVTINCDTADVTIYYTKDGTTPTSASLQYNSSTKFTINNDATIKAIAIKSGYQSSEVATNAFTVGTPKMYYSVVDNAPTTLDGIKGMTPLEKKAFPVTIPSSGTLSGYGKVCLAYPSALGTITSIKDGNNTEYNGNFDTKTVGTYTIRVMKAAADQSGLKYTFSK